VFVEVLNLEMTHKQDALPDDDDLESEDEYYPFYVNKNGFPVDQHTWERMWKYAAKTYPDAKKQIDKIKNSDTAAEVMWTVLVLIY